MERRKGIRSLIPTGTLSEREEVVQEIPVEELQPSPFQPRQQVGEEGLQELVESIRVHGILQPLVARRHQGQLQLIAGERRLRAAKRAGLARVPVIVRSAGDREMLELALVENLQREDINPMEAAEAYRSLIEHFDLTQEQVAERVGKSRSAVANSLRLLTLPAIIQESLRRGQIEEGHGKVLAAIKETRPALMMWRRVVKRGLSVRETAEAVAKLLNRPVPRGTMLGQPKTEAALDPNLQHLRDRLMERLGVRVRIRPSAKGPGGVIEIEYADIGELNEIWDAVGG